MQDPDKQEMFIATLISGSLSGLTLMIMYGIYEFGPGVLFGIATAIVLRSTGRLDTVRALLWAIASQGAWYFAIHYYTAQVNTSSSLNVIFVTMLISGLIGSAFLAFAYAVLTQTFDPRSGAIVVCCGVALAAVMHVVLYVGITSSHNSDSLVLSFARNMVAFATWQMGAGLSLMYYGGTKGKNKARRARQA